MQHKEYNTMEDEFGSSFMSEDEYNKLRAKEQKKSMPQTTKIKRRKKKKKKESINHFKGLGSGSSRGPWPKIGGTD